MKLATILALCLGTVIASPTPATHDNEKPKIEWDGFPSDSVSCPNHEGPDKASFDPGYMKQDIEGSISLKKKKGYPATFGTGHSGASQFNFQNNCMGRATGGNKEKIQEMPMIEGGKSWAEAGSNPGAYRVYFIREKKNDNDYKVTYCGAYAHTDKDDKGKFGACT